MARSYFSTVLDVPADEVWSAIRDFGKYGWAGVPSETIIEGGGSGDAVGGVRRVQTGERLIRQRLLSHSDLDRSYTYSLCDPAPFPVRDYVATLRVTPVVDGDRAFVEWWATFDCAEPERWTAYFRDEGFARWLGALRRAITPRACGSDRRVPAPRA
jgi:hypothetical protein